MYGLPDMCALTLGPAALRLLTGKPLMSMLQLLYFAMAFKDDSY